MLAGAVGVAAVLAGGDVLIRALRSDPAAPTGPFNAAAAARRVLDSPAALESTDHDVLAYRARTAANLVIARHPVPELAPILDRLWERRYVIDGHPGFGLPYTWGAINGATNPLDTIYTYTTATAALTFLDAADATRNTEYRQKALLLARTLLARCAGNGVVWYSDQPGDAVKVVPNVNGLTLALLVRLGVEPGMQAGLRARLGSEMAPDGSWPYIVDGTNGSNAPSDLEHHSFIVEGVVAARMPEADKAVRYLASFFQSDGLFDRHDVNVMGSTAWGPPDGLAALAMAGREQLARNVARVLADSVNADGVSSFADQSKPRSVAHYGFGLARYAASAVLGDDHRSR